MPLVEEFNAETAPVPKSYEMTAVNDQLLRTNGRWASSRGCWWA